MLVTVRDRALDVPAAPTRAILSTGDGDPVYDGDGHRGHVGQIHTVRSQVGKTVGTDKVKDGRIAERTVRVVEGQRAVGRTCYENSREASRLVISIAIISQHIARGRSDQRSCGLLCLRGIVHRHRSRVHPDVDSHRGCATDSRISILTDAVLEGICTGKFVFGV